MSEKTVQVESATTFEQLNSPESYDVYRSDESYCLEDGQRARYLKRVPDDLSNPREPRSVIALTGLIRIGFDPRTHAVLFNGNEIRIVPIKQ